MTICVQLLGDPCPQHLGGQKRPKFGAISDNFRRRPRISLEGIDVSKIGKPLDQLPPLPRLVEKVDELWSTNKNL